MGEYLGEIESVKGNRIIISTDKELMNGDGLAVISPLEKSPDLGRIYAKATMYASKRHLY